MKNKLVLETLRTIRRSIGKYLMLMLIVLLGVAFFSGMLSISDAMGQSVDKYTDKTNFLDFHVYSNYGFDAADVDAVNALDDDFTAQGGNFIDAEGVCEDESYVFRVESYSEEDSLNQLTLTQGRYPESPDEALAEVSSNLYTVPEIGQTVRIERANEELGDVLAYTEFTIVGVVTTPNFMSFEKGTSTLDNLMLDTFLYVPEQAFAADYYSVMYVQSTAAKQLDSFDAAYTQQIESDEETLESLAATQQLVRAEEIKGEAQEEYDEGLADYTRALEDFNEEIANAQDEIDAGYEELEAAQVDIDAAIQQLEAARAPLSALVASGAADAQTTATLDGIQAQLYALEQNEQELDTSREELEQAQDELNESRTEGETELNDAKAELLDAQAEIEELSEGEWTILSRDMHYSMASYSDTVTQMQVIGLIFPVFFFLVAALVCLTTMTRMVDEQRGQIGVLRALGYSRLACASKYIVYALSATVFGGAIGSVLGVLVFPPIIYSTWGMMYNLPPIDYDLPILIMLFAILIFAVVMGLTTFSAIRIETSQVASNLMRPKAPPAGKKVFLEKIPFLWKRFSFNAKVTARNIIRYKKRFFMTITGIAGCTCLLVSGFGMRGSIGNIAQLQYDELTLYSGTVSITEEATAEQFEQALSTANSLGEDTVAVGLSSYSAQTSHGEEELVAFVNVYENDEQMKEMNIVRQRGSEEEFALGDSAVLISEKMAELLGAKAGDTITLESKDGKTASAQVGGVFERYIQHEVYISEQYYETLFDEVPMGNAVQLKSGLGEEEIRQSIMSLEGVGGITFNTGIVSGFDSIVNGMDLVVIVIIVSAAALAFVVLGNLANINISERKREIATLKVLGFRHKETKNYIFNESIVLTLFGSLFGAVLGLFAHNFIITQVEMDFVMFGRVASIDSILYSVLLTFVFSIFINRFMLSKLKHINMIESLKSVE